MQKYEIFVFVVSVLCVHGLAIILTQPLTNHNFKIDRVLSVYRVGHGDGRGVCIDDACDAILPQNRGLSDIIINNL